MKNTEDKRKFSQFLASEFSNENMLFLDVIEQFKRDFSSRSLQENILNVQTIYDKYINPAGQYPINIPYNLQRIHEAIITLLEDSSRNLLPPSLPGSIVTVDMFDNLYKSIINLLKADSYPRFLRQQSLISK